MITDKACWERGCACHDSRDSPGVELVLKREWVGLTDEEVSELSLSRRYLVREVEAKLKERNT